MMQSYMSASMTSNPRFSIINDYKTTNLNVNCMNYLLNTDTKERTYLNLKYYVVIIIDNTKQEVYRSSLIDTGTTLKTDSLTVKLPLGRYIATGYIRLLQPDGIILKCESGVRVTLDVLV